MTHYHVERTRKTGMSEMTERVGYAWLTSGEAQIAADRQTMVTNRADGEFQVSEPCNCPAEVAPESTNRMINSLHERVQAVEARQRAYGMHDPNCPEFLTEQAQKGTDMLLAAADCNCWLSKESQP